MSAEQLMPRNAIARPPDASASAAEKLTWALNHAVLAPSKHNTQPWYFKVGHDAVDVHADGARGLTASDPYGREMLISCGAALANLCLGIRALGYRAEVHVFPQGAFFSHLARVRLGEPEELTAAERRLVEAIPRRQTQRLPLDATRLPESLLLALSECARREGARLTFVTSRRGEREMAELIRRAGLIELEHDDRRRELQRWVRSPEDPASDGIPAENRGLGPAGADLRFATRDFLVDGSSPPPVDPSDDAPILALLSTLGDEPVHWLTAGRALQMVLLRASVDDVHASFVNQPIELAETRRAVAEVMGVGGHPQMLLRLGWGVGALCTPRRPVAEIADIHDPLPSKGRAT